MKKFFSLVFVLCCTLTNLQAQEVIKGKRLFVASFDANCNLIPVAGIKLESRTSAETDKDGMATIDMECTMDTLYDSGEILKDYRVKVVDPMKAENSMDLFYYSFTKLDSATTDTLYVRTETFNVLYLEQAFVNGLRNIYANENLTQDSRNQRIVVLKEALKCHLINSKYKVHPDFFSGKVNDDFYEGDNLLLNPTDENLAKWIDYKFPASQPAFSTFAFKKYIESSFWSGEDNQFLLNLIYSILGRSEDLYEMYKYAAKDGPLGEFNTYTFEVRQVPIAAYNYRVICNMPDIVHMAATKHDTTVIRNLLLSPSRRADVNKRKLTYGHSFNNWGISLFQKGDYREALKFFDASYIAFDCVADAKERKSNLLYPMANIALVAQNLNEENAEEKWMNTLNLVTELEDSIENGTARRAWTERAMADYYAGIEQNDKAQEYYDLSIQHYTHASQANAGELPELENTLWRKATFLENTGMYKNAIKVYKEEIKVLDKLILKDEAWRKNKADIELAIKEASKKK